MDSSFWFGLAENVLLALTLVVTIAAAAVVAWQTQRHFALQRSQEYIQRFNTVEMNEVQRRVDRWLAMKEPVWDLLEQAQQDLESGALDTPALKNRADIILVANFFQELGTAMRFKALEKNYTWGVFGGLVRRYWNGLRPFIYHFRYREKRRTFFEDFEELAGLMRRLDAKHGVDDAQSREGESDDTWVFGYGSLISPESASKTAGRAYSRSEMIMAWLEDHRRAWTVYDRVVFDGTENTAPAVFLNVTPETGQMCSGVLLPVDSDALNAFDKRERQYHRVDVTHLVTPCPPGRVYTYVAKAEATRIPEGAVVARQYQDLVHDAVNAWGETMRRDFTESTTDHGFPLRDGAYVFHGANSPGSA